MQKEAVPTFGQMDLYNYRLGEIAEELEKVNLDELTPLNALNILSKMKEKLWQNGRGTRPLRIV